MMTTMTIAAPMSNHFFISQPPFTGISRFFFAWV
jgi:hypothetical protein